MGQQQLTRTPFQSDSFVIDKERRASWVVGIMEKGAGEEKTVSWHGNKVLWKFPHSATGYLSSTCISSNTCCIL